MAMLLRHLRYFVTLARERHFARAAEACNISQPTLSGAIATLERELGVRLAVRGRRYLDLTPEGRLVLDHALRLLQDEDDLLRGIESLRGGLTGTLRLGVIPAAMPIVGTLVGAFAATHPAVLVEVRSMTSRAIHDALVEFEIDAGLTYLEADPPPRVRCLPLYREHYLFATGADGPLARRERIDWREAASQRLCLLSEDMQHRRNLDAVFALNKVEVRPAMVSNSFLAILSQLRAGGGWSSIVPHSFAQLFGDQPDLVLIPLIEPLHLQPVGLVTSDREPAPPLARAFEQSVRISDLALRIPPTAD